MLYFINIMSLNKEITMKKLTNRQKQAIATKLKITETSITLFKERGFESVKIQDICEAADISVGAFYHHFKSKSHIISTAFIQVDSLIREYLEAKSFTSHLNRLRALLTKGSELLEELGWAFVGEAYKNLISCDEKYTFIDYEFVSFELANCIEMASSNKELKDNVDPDQLAETIMRISRGVIFDWCLHKGEYSLNDQILFDNNLILSIYSN